ncbi:hypothetical protein ACIGN6_36420 [Streptomyces sp. NPDC053792]|uniref:hypothetical protein n=1 Tax=Streptomyces sp. NPDC053792 TaxID=3365716 RepID=UPI0037D28BCD
MDTATTMLDSHITEAWPEIDPESRALAIETLVRLTVSHLVQPIAPPDRTAERIAEVFARVVRP